MKIIFRLLLLTIYLLGFYVKSGVKVECLRDINLENIHEIRLVSSIPSRTNSSLAFSPDSKKLASARGNTVEMWNIETGELANTLESSAVKETYVESLSFNPNADVLAIGWEDEVVLWNIETDEGTVLATQDNLGVLDVTFSANGKLLAAGGADRIVRIWDTETQKKIIEYENKFPSSTSGIPGLRITSLAFHADNQFLAIGTDEGTIILLNLSTFQETMQFNAFPSDSSVNEILFYGDILLASGSDGIRKWNINKGDELEQLEIFFVWDFDVLPSHILATSGYVDKVANTPNILQLWNINSNELLTTLYDDEGVYITDIAFNRQGTILALGGGSGKIDLWGITEECT